MKTVLALPSETSAASVFRRKPKIAWLHPAVGPARRRAFGRFKLSVRFYESPGAALPVRILNPGAPAAAAAAPENQTH